MDASTPESGESNPCLSKIKHSNPGGAWGAGLAVIAAPAASWRGFFRRGAPQSGFCAETPRLDRRDQRPGFGSLVELFRSGETYSSWTTATWRSSHASPRGALPCGSGGSGASAMAEWRPAGSECDPIGRDPLAEVRFQASVLLIAQHGRALGGHDRLHLIRRGVRRNDGYRQRLAVLSDALLGGSALRRRRPGLDPAAHRRFLRPAAVPRGNRPDATGMAVRPCCRSRGGSSLPSELLGKPITVTPYRAMSSTATGLEVLERCARRMVVRSARASIGLSWKGRWRRYRSAHAARPCNGPGAAGRLGFP